MKWLLFALALSAPLAACNAISPVPGPEVRCTEACKARVRGCEDWQCARGCRFMLDRLVEHEEPTVLACVARAKNRCDDQTFADCASRAGPLVDGGPAPPKPPSEEDEP
ncbi:MAG TPA: hypothetical protein VGI39_45795 [Polyangiaceae bacterium]|jgi:hypothetical protein